MNRNYYDNSSLFVLNTSKAVLLVGIGEMLVGRDFERQDTKPFLPNGWRWVRLGEVCVITMGQSPDGASYNTDGYGEPLLNGPTEFGPISPTPKQWTTSPTRFAEVGDILLCVRGATTGRKNIADRHYCIGRGLAAIQGASEKTTTRFLWFVLDLVTISLLQEASGSTFPNLPVDKLGRVEIPLPPLSEQDRIVEILNTKMVLIEQARAAVEAQLEMAKALPAAYLRAAFNSPEAQRWPRRRLGEICHLLPSKSIATDGDTEVCAITTACLTELGFQASGVKLARMWFEDAAECRVSPGEILIARSNTLDLVGRVAMFAGEPEDAVASDLTIRILPSNSVYSRFLTAYLSLLYLSGYWKERAGGASGSMKKITRSQIQAEQLPTPPLSEQRRIAEALNEQMGAVESMCKALEAQLDAINKLPAALLRQAFRGELG